MPWTDPQFSEEKKESKGVMKTVGFLPKLFYKNCKRCVNYFIKKQSKFSLSKYYFIFLEQFQRLSENIEKNPHLNFLSLLQTYKIVIEVLDGKVSYFYYNRNKLWFKHFFPDEELYNLVKADLERFHARFPNVKLTITKDGTMIYDNYKKNKFNFLVVTPHDGTWMPKHIQELQKITKEQRYNEEDVGTNIVYGPLALIKGGIWINVKQSRFVCDYNRSKKRSIYTNTSEKRLKNIWKQSLNSYDREYIHSRYDNFYFILDKIIETHRFNIIFDGHSMVDEKGRPPISFGLKYVPAFYMPIVREIKKTLEKNSSIKVHINTPYSGGNILKRLSEKFPDVFIFSMELNKSMYMDQKHMILNYWKATKIQQQLLRMFEF